jgi:hypothetical protein
MKTERDVEFQFEHRLQAERIDGRKGWARYIELKTAMRREHVERIAAELGAIREGLRRSARRT